MPKDTIYGPVVPTIIPTIPDFKFDLGPIGSTYISNYKPKNQLFLDSADCEEIRMCLKKNIVSGITTNPSLMSSTKLKTKKNDFKTYLLQLQTIADIIQENTLIQSHLSVEVISTDPDKMLDEALKLKESCSRNKIDLHIKIPILWETLELINLLIVKGLKVNATAAMTALQAKMVSDFNIPVVSFFYNRMMDGLLTDIRPSYGKNKLPQSELDKARKLANEELVKYKNYNFQYTKTICGSIRTPQDVEECWKNGVNIVTAPLKVIKQMLYHFKTEEAVNNFNKDIQEWLKGEK